MEILSSSGNSFVYKANYWVVIIIDIIIIVFTVIFIIILIFVWLIIWVCAHIMWYVLCDNYFHCYCSREHHQGKALGAALWIILIQGKLLIDFLLLTLFLLW